MNIFMLSLLVGITILAGCQTTPPPAVVEEVEENTPTEVIVEEIPPATPDSQIDVLAEIIRKHPDIPSGQIDIAVYYSDATHAYGVITHNRGDLVEPISWWAVQEEDQWQIVALDRNDPVLCTTLEDHGFADFALGNCQQ